MDRIILKSFYKDAERIQELEDGQEGCEKVSSRIDMAITVINSQQLGLATEEFQGVKLANTPV